MTPLRRPSRLQVFTTPEWRNYLRRVIAERRLGWGVHTVREGLRLLERRRAFRQGRAGRSAMDGLPPSGAPTAMSASFLRGFARPWPVNGGDVACPPPVDLPLVTTSVSAVPAPEWAAEFAELEDVLALHRWGWALRLLATHSCPQLPMWILDRMLQWVERCGPPRPGAPAWESYSVSERIANALVFLSATRACSPRNSDAERRLVGALGEMGAFLAGRLEDHGDRTNNHLVNNARALYLFGAATDQDRYASLGRALLERMLPRLVTEDGFLREGSSHYHFLLTRTVAEIHRAAEAVGDDGVLRLTEPYRRRMLDRCRFFLLESPDGAVDIPRIGDVSPDCTVPWLLDLVAPGPPRGWGRLIEPPAAAPRAERSAAPSVEAFPESGWYRTDVGPLTIFWRIERTGRPDHPSHGHNDSGAFCAFLEGRPLLVDVGRRSYATDAGSRFPVQAFAHNSVALDGFEPFPDDWLGWFPPAYTRSSCRADVKVSAAGVEVVVAHDGFERVRRGVRFERTLSCRTDGFTLHDRYAGSGPAEIEAFFHWAPGSDPMPAAPDRLAVSTPAGTITALVQCQGADGPATCETSHHRGEGGAFPLGWYHGEYGQAVPTLSSRVRARVTLPASRVMTVLVEGMEAR